MENEFKNMVLLYKFLACFMTGIYMFVSFFLLRNMIPLTDDFLYYLYGITVGMTTLTVVITIFAGLSTLEKKWSK